MRGYGGRVFTVAGLAALLFGTPSAPAQQAPPLGDAASFAVLGSTGVTAKGTATLGGNAGTGSGPVKGLEPGNFTLGGVRNDLASKAQEAAAAAYGNIRDQKFAKCDPPLYEEPITPGLYCFSTALQLNGHVLLKGDGPWIFQVPQGLTTAPGSAVLVAGGDERNVYWQVAGSATLADDTAFAGNILALESISLGARTRLPGRALALGGSVTLNGANKVSMCCPPITLTPATLPDGRVGEPYPAPAFAADGGKSPYGDIAVSWGSVDGLDRHLVGTPRKEGKFPIAVTAVDADGCANTRYYEVVINCLPITVSPPNLHPRMDACVSAYDETISAKGGTGPYTFAMTPPVAGLMLDPTTGRLEGTPTEPGPPELTITATDTSTNCSGSHTYPTVGGPPLMIEPEVLPDGCVGKPYNVTFVVAGGTPPYIFVVCGGTLPPGLSLSAAGVLAGIPTTNGDFTFTLGVIDVRGARGTRTYTLHIGCQPDPLRFVPPPPPLPAAQACKLYCVKFNAAGGMPPYTFTSSTLPITNPNGELCGTLTPLVTPTTQEITVRVTDAAGSHVDESLTLSISEPFTLSPLTLPLATVCTRYCQQLTASGGVGSYVFEGSGLPPGLSLSSSGLLAGKPTEAGEFESLVKVTDQGTGCFLIRPYPLPVSGGGGGGSKITLSPPTLTIPSGTLNVPYAEVLMASGGTPPYRFEQVIGSGTTLPKNLTLSPGGTISGTPIQNGSFRFTIRVRDSGSRCTGDRFTYSISIYPLP